MRRFFVKNLLFIVGVNLLVKPAWVLIIDRNVQNRVGHAAYGTYQALFNLALIFSIVLDFGLNNYNTSMVAQRHDKVNTLFPTMLSSRLLLIGAYALLVMGTGYVIGYRNNELLLLAGVLLIQSLNVLMQFIRGNVAGLQKFKVDGLLSVTDRFLMILLCGFLLYYPLMRAHFKIEWFIATQIVCYTAAIITGFFVLRKLVKVRLALTTHLASIYGIIKKSFPYALLIFLMSVYMRADTMLVERLCGTTGKEQAGVYAACYRLLDVGNMFGLMLANMLLPLYGKMLAQKTDVQPVTKLSVNLLFPLSVIIAVIGIFYGKEIMHLLYIHARDADGIVFAWLIASFPAFCIMYVYSTLLTANGSLRMLNKIAFAGVVINLSVNFYLIPRIGALGAAISCFITEWSLAVAYVHFARTIVALPINLKWVGALTGFGILMLAVSAAISYLHEGWKVNTLVIVIIGALCILLFRFVDVKGLKAVMNKG